MSDLGLSMAIQSTDNTKSPPGITFSELSEGAVLEIFNFLYIRDCVRIKRINKDISRLASIAMARQQIVRREFLVIITEVLAKKLSQTFDFKEFLKHLHDVTHLGLFDFSWPSSVRQLLALKSIDNDPYDALFMSQHLPNIESFGSVHVDDIDVIISYATNLKEAGKPVKIKVVEVGTESIQMSPSTVRDLALKMAKIVELCPDLESVTVRAPLMSPSTSKEPHWQLLSRVIASKVFPRVKHLHVINNLDFPNFINTNPTINLSLKKIQIRTLAVDLLVIKNIVRCAPNLEKIDFQYSNVDVFRELLPLKNLRSLCVNIFSKFESIKYNRRTRKKAVVDYLKIRGRTLKYFLFTDEGPEFCPIDNFSVELVKYAPNLVGIRYPTFDWTLAGQFKKLRAVDLSKYVAVKNVKTVLNNAPNLSSLTVTTYNQAQAKIVNDFLETTPFKNFVHKNCRFLNRILVVGWPPTARRAFRY